MKAFKIISLFFICLNLLSCVKVEKENEIIGNPNDYEKYLFFNDSTQIVNAKKKLIFWNKKYAEAPNQYLYLGKLAKIHETLFELNGNINHLKRAENYYSNSIQISDSSDIEILHSLSRNYISQHKFKECLPLLKKAKLIGFKKLITNQILFDIYLELGNTDKAKKYIDSIKNPKDFNYLIRKAKWEDHKGNLDNAINFLKLATNIAEKENNNYLKIWSYSNLGDFLGHQGEIKKSYQYYLKTLELDPNNTYVLKKIAWIQYANNTNVNEANRILDAIIKQKETPDIYLLKAELASFSNDSIFTVINENIFLEFASKPEYGAMYNKYLVDVLSSKKTRQGLNHSKSRNKKSPTAQSYDLLAWSYYNRGKYKKALEIVQKHVVNHTYEPEILFHIASIYKANQTAPNTKEELNQASFELGPLLYKKVKAL